MASFHSATFDLLGTRPQTSLAAVRELDDAERRLGIQLPRSVREWYSYDDALTILADHSNDDPPIPVREFAILKKKSRRLMPIRWENQGVCTWAILLDGSDDPQVFVDVDSAGARWTFLAPTFSTYVYACVWDYRNVFGQPGMVQAQNGPISAQTIQALASVHVEGPRTFGWPGSTHYRFSGDRHGLLIWSNEGQADWIVGSADGASLESALRMIWKLDGVGESFYDRSEIAKKVLDRVRADS